MVREVWFVGVGPLGGGGGGGGGLGKEEESIWEEGCHVDDDEKFLWHAGTHSGE